MVGCAFPSIKSTKHGQPLAEQLDVVKLTGDVAAEAIKNAGWYGNTRGRRSTAAAVIRNAAEAAKNPAEVKTCHQRHCGRMRNSDLVLARRWREAPLLLWQTLPPSASRQVMISQVLWQTLLPPSSSVLHEPGDAARGLPSRGRSSLAL